MRIRLLKLKTSMFDVTILEKNSSPFRRTVKKNSMHIPQTENERIPHPIFRFTVQCWDNPLYNKKILHSIPQKNTTALLYIYISMYRFTSIKWLVLVFSFYLGSFVCCFHVKVRHNINHTFLLNFLLEYLWVFKLYG